MSTPLFFNMIKFYDDKIVLTNYPNFNVKDTLECGQFFRYKQVDSNVYHVFAQDKFAKVTTIDNVIEIATTDTGYFYNFFDLATDYSQPIQRLKSISTVLNEAVEYGQGIRILRQNFVETLYSFIISANNNIKRIQQIIDKICQRFGAKSTNGYAFPTVEALSSATVQDFLDLGAGYRATYLVNTTKALLAFDPSTLDGLSTQEARKVLLNFCGVGPKVADCILLFGLQKKDVFPVDTWIKKVYHKYFEKGHKDNQIANYLVSLFGEDAGLCQQYLFYFQRKYLQNESNSLQ